MEILNVNNNNYRSPAGRRIIYIIYMYNNNVFAGRAADQDDEAEFAVLFASRAPFNWNNNNNNTRTRPGSRGAGHFNSDNPYW